MNLVVLPTNELWTDSDWRYVLAGSEFYEGAFTAPDGQRADDITADRIGHVDIWAVENPEEMADYNFAALVELTDGTWAACVAWTDTSGWGCQQGVYWRIAATRDDAIRFCLDKDARRRLGLSLVGE